MTKFCDYVCCKEHHAHMKMRQNQNKTVCKYNKAENWFLDEYLSKTKLKWTRQAQWGWNLFDFWNRELGLDIEIDGSDHDSIKDYKRDRKLWKRSAIRVIRVKNFDDLSAQMAVELIEDIDSWNHRRALCGMKLIK